MELAQYGRVASLVDLHRGFRDEERRHSAQAVVMQYLADDPLMPMSERCFVAVIEVEIERHVHLGGPV
ncbi:hypothetical protein [Dactylosporangium sp. CA-233914]|uniref:hypothetical protein n=1 Tax=Dactylosporangium sp. CA-233914 TaxID=3239934 RepID=UPI003D924CB0